MIKDFVAIDLETTGLSPYDNKIIELGAVRYRDGKPVDQYNTLINPGVHIPERITEITGIDDDMVSKAPYIDDELDRIMEFIGNDVILGHNVIFDYTFIAGALAGHSIEYSAEAIDTLKFAKKVLSANESKNLEHLCEMFDIVTIHHRAYEDAMSAANVYFRLCELSGEETIVEQYHFKKQKAAGITPKQVNYLKSLIERHNIKPDYIIENLTKSQASREIDRILSEYGITRRRT